MKFAYAITTMGSGGKFLQTTLDNIPTGSRVLLVENQRPLSRGWNFAIDKLLWDETYDACIIMNDDVILRPDTGELLAWGILEGQFQEDLGNPHGTYASTWPRDFNKEILLLSARHAHWSDARTDEPDWEILKDAKPAWQPGPDFSCFCVSRRLGQVVGRFDEQFNPAYFEDNDMHRRIQLAGFEGGAFAPYWHFRNGSTRNDVADQEVAKMILSNFEGCKRYYCSKWGAPYDGVSPVGRETFLTPFGQ